ncbi:hypothetical protein EpJS98_gp256 [Escherichia phage JS98]|uniref:Acridine resistance protein n=2 Tax=Dhakavirus TaxID=1914165 RepID=A0A2S1GNR5_9CAUD|nr:hypothetical protein EpJS98_gp256 [Escherichia phage JS98]YP_010094155.1 hypothetical protein KNT84_gp012 [Enterobacteria phage vB_EcoM_IME281]QAY00017.1 hypothetical protein EcWhh1_84 [Escherichia phage EcWhh-1]QBP35604.1 acridine resistance [Phage NC-G]CAI9865716.1 hypothetical protein PFGHJN_00012 [Escherichia phage UP19]ABX11170.1 hypothetical protein EpJS98_0256 [Escherichia phage JS98]AWD91022.1 hypothetical protein [Enterobacteria phage vB_EcoM_IME281]
MNILQGFAAGIWTYLGIWTITTGETSVISQAIPQFILAFVLILQAFTKK